MAAAMPPTNEIITPTFAADEFETLGLAMMMGKSRRAQRRSEKLRLRRFRSFFGADPLQCAIAWFELELIGWNKFKDGVRGVKPDHLLWTLLLMKQYGTEELMSALVGTTEKTFRKWTDFILQGFDKLSSKFVSILH
jgi:hypothetical protein